MLDAESQSDDDADSEVASIVPNTYNEENHIFHFHFIDGVPNAKKYEFYFVINTTRYMYCADR